jgi:hypothetical protein
MRTTIDIPDAMYRRLKAQAAIEGRSIKSLILRGAEQALSSKPTASSHKVKLPLIHARRPGSLRVDDARIYDVISFP